MLLKEQRTSQVKDHTATTIHTLQGFVNKWHQTIVHYLQKNQMYTIGVYRLSIRIFTISTVRHGLKLESSCTADKQYITSLENEHLY